MAIDRHRWTRDRRSRRCVRGRPFQHPLDDVGWQRGRGYRTAAAFRHFRRLGRGGRHRCGSHQRRTRPSRSWEGAKAGLDATIWLPSGDRWVRQPSAGSALQSSSDLLVGSRSVTSDGAGIVLAGSAVHLAAGKVRQSAAVWRSQQANQGWARLDLPDSGATSEAVSATCKGQNCVVAGYVDGAVTLWRLSASGAVRIPEVPLVALNPTSPIPAPLVLGVRTI
jgi:hypothetical protein